MKFRYAVLFLITATGFAVLADNLCMRNGYCEDIQSLAKRIGAVGTDRRMTEEEFADKGLPYKVPLSSVQKRFAPTGDIDCPNGPGSGQLTGDPGLITTAAHLFYDMETCKLLDKPQTCTFTVKIGIDEYKSKLKPVAREDIGFKCNDKQNPRDKKSWGGEQSPYDDWAVLELDPPIENVGHYEVPEEDHVVEEDGKVIAVLAGSLDFPARDKQGRVIQPITYPKTIENCQRKKIYGPSPVRLMETTCDNAQLGSGGSLLQRFEKRDFLVGIVTSNKETKEELARARASKTEIRKEYKPGEWTTFVVPLKGEFRKAVLRHAKSSI